MKSAYQEYANSIVDKCGIDPQVLEDLWNENSKTMKISITTRKKYKTVSSVSSSDTCPYMYVKGLSCGTVCGAKIKEGVNFCSLHKNYKNVSVCDEECSNNSNHNESSDENKNNESSDENMQDCEQGVGNEEVEKAVDDGAVLKKRKKKYDINDKKTKYDITVVDSDGESTSYKKSFGKVLGHLKNFVANSTGHEIIEDGLITYIDKVSNQSIQIKIDNPNQLKKMIKKEEWGEYYEGLTHVEN